MGEIKLFDDYKRKYNQEVSGALNKILSTSVLVCEKYEKYTRDHEEQFEYLQNYLTKIIMKYKHSFWKNESVEKSFLEIDKYYTYNFYNTRDKEEKVYIILYQMISVYVYDICPSIANEDIDFIKEIIESFSVYLISDFNNNIEGNKNIIKTILKPIIKENLSDDKELLKENLLEVIYLVDQGYDTSNVIAMMAELSEELDDLTTGVITIPRIYNFYSKEIDRFCTETSDGSFEYYNDIKDIYLSKIDGMLSIDNYDEMAKSNFIYIINFLRKDGLNPEKELGVVFSLIDIYNHFGQDVKNLSLDNLMNLSLKRYKTKYKKNMLIKRLIKEDEYEDR